MNALIKTYRDHFQIQPNLLIQAPGRINIIGEHTDYHGGYVLPAAIDRYMEFAIGHNRHSDSVRIVASDLNEEIHLSLNQLEPSDKSWANYFIGTLTQLRELGHRIGGLDLVFGGNIPIGGGLSSSSALECGFICGLNELFELDLELKDMIEISRRSNHQFLGLQGGIMDQYSILFGKANNAMLLHCDTMTHEYVPIDLADHQFILIDSKVSHELVSSAYNDRVAEGKCALSKIKKVHPDIKNLSAVSKSMLEDLKHLLTDMEYKRVKHVASENARVHVFCRAMLEKDYLLMGELLYASHESLSRDYEVSCEEMDLLIDLAQDSSGVIGSRMMGGGFGGCALNIVKDDQIEKVKMDILTAYEKHTGIKAEVYLIDIVDGVSITSI